MTHASHVRCAAWRGMAAAAGLAAVLTLATGLGGCSHRHPSAPEAAAYTPPLDSPQNVLQALKYAYENRDIELLRRLFTDDFVFVEDTAGSVSETSNLATLEPAPSIAAGLALAPLGNPGSLPAEIQWFAAADVAAGGRALQIFDITGRAVARLGIPAGVEGIVRWDGRDRAGRVAQPGLYFVRLPAPGHAVTGRLVLVR